MTPMPHPLYSPNLTWNNFFFISPDEKILKGNHFPEVEEVKQKIAEALKGIKIDEFKNYFESGKNSSISELHQRALGR